MTSHTAMDANATHVHIFYALQVRARWVLVRRNQNAFARRLGFRNFMEWLGDEE